MDRVWGFVRSLVIYNNPRVHRAWRRFYRTLLTPGMTAFDVGAHVGTRARAMRAAGVHVVALEPQEPFATFLRQTLPRDISVVTAAVGRSEARAHLSVSNRHPTVSSLSGGFVSGATTAPGFQHVRWNASQVVDVVTLDSLIERWGTPDYIKIDVEGYEVEVLAGLTTPVPLVSIEYLPGFVDVAHQAITRLLELGEYRFNPVFGEAAEFLWPTWRSATDIRSWLDSLSPDQTSGDIFARLERMDSSPD